MITDCPFYSFYSAPDPFLQNYPHSDRTCFVACLSKNILFPSSQTKLQIMNMHLLFSFKLIRLFNNP